jgi:hypothetical protein
MNLNGHKPKFGVALSWITSIFALFAYIVLALSIDLLVAAISPSFSSSFSIVFFAITFIGPAVLIWLMKKYVFSNMG